MQSQRSGVYCLFAHSIALGFYKKVWLSKAASKPLFPSSLIVVKFLNLCQQTEAIRNNYKYKKMKWWISTYLLKHGCGELYSEFFCSYVGGLVHIPHCCNERNSQQLMLHNYTDGHRWKINGSVSLFSCIWATLMKHLKLPMALCTSHWMLHVSHRLWVHNKGYKTMFNWKDRLVAYSTQMFHVEESWIPSILLVGWLSIVICNATQKYVNHATRQTTLSLAHCHGTDFVWTSGKKT